MVDDIFTRATTSVGYCHVDHGCKMAATGLISNNGIVKGKDDKIYVVDSAHGKISVFEPQADNTLVLVDEIGLGA